MGVDEKDTVGFSGVTMLVRHCDLSCFTSCRFLPRAPQFLSYTFFPFYWVSIKKVFFVDWVDQVKKKMTVTRFRITEAKKICTFQYSLCFCDFCFISQKIHFKLINAQVPFFPRVFRQTVRFPQGDPRPM